MVTWPLNLNMREEKHKLDKIKELKLQLKHIGSCIEVLQVQSLT